MPYKCIYCQKIIGEIIIRGKGRKDERHPDKEGIDPKCILSTNGKHRWRYQESWKFDKNKNSSLNKLCKCGGKLILSSNCKLMAPVYICDKCGTKYAPTPLLII